MERAGEKVECKKEYHSGKFAQPIPPDEHALKADTLTRYGSLAALFDTLVAGGPGSAPGRVKCHFRRQSGVGHHSAPGLRACRLWLRQTVSSYVLARRAGRHPGQYHRRRDPLCHGAGCRKRSEEHTSELQSREQLVCRCAPGRTAVGARALSLHDALPIFGLSAIFVVSLVSATILPLGSEPAVFGYVKLSPHMFWPAVLVATLGNTIGGVISYAMGLGAE